ncbi:MAG: hypothetical protein QNI91_08175 [Arenicellales bacterium]|nr:hypothetical protein [Arenicellales bacterium]
MATLWPAMMRWYDRFLFAPLLYVATVYLLDIVLTPFGLLPGIVGPWFFSATVAGAGVIMARRWKADRIFVAESVATSAHQHWSLMLWGLVTLMVGLLYWGGCVFPSHDAVAILAFGRRIAANQAILQIPFASEATWAAYPPGLPILLSLLFSGLSTVNVLSIFKWALLLVIATIPLIWACYCQRLFRLRIPLILIHIAFVVGVFLLERTLLLAPSFAGKYALIVTGALLPFCLWSVSQAYRSIGSFTLAVVSILGLVLIHYSAIHLLFIFIPFLCLAMWQPHAKRRARFTLGAVAAICSAVLFVPMALFAKAAGIEQQAQQDIPFFELFGDALLGYRSHFLFIFHDVARLSHWPNKGWVLLGAIALVVALWAMSSKTKRLLKQCAWLALGGGVAVVLGAMLGSGLVSSAQVSLDYARWFSFVPQFIVFSIVVLAVCIVTIKAWQGKNRRLAAMVGIVALGVLSTRIPYVWDDARQVRLLVKASHISRQEIKEATSTLAAFSEKAPCYVATQGLPIADRYAHGYRLVSYVPVVSDCTVVSGSWIHTPMPGGRDNDGFPSQSFVQRLNDKGADLVFVGDLTVAQQYATTAGLIIDEAAIRPFGSAKAVPMVASQVP